MTTSSPIEGAPLRVPGESGGAGDAPTDAGAQESRQPPRPRGESPRLAPGMLRGDEESRQFPCAQCGADLSFKPGAESLVCAYCGHESPIVLDGEAAIEEEDYSAALEALASDVATIESRAHRCRTCGAESVFGPGVSADLCAYCGSAIVGDVTGAAIAPKALLPFKVGKDQARAAFAKWLAALWFAPSALKGAADRQALQGCYLPYYTYDAETSTDYRGQRGEDYWDTEHYTTTVNGRTEHRTRQVRRTRWHPASGRVRVSFDDILVLAGKGLPRKQTEALEPWDLQALAPYDEQYLSGFQAQRAQLGLEQGFAAARARMQPAISSAIRRDIGGDHQRIHHKSTRYRDVTFKHLLLPLWISAYRYRERVFRFVINARTGEVQGERPWSLAKIIGLALGLIGVVALLALIAALAQ